MRKYHMSGVEHVHMMRRVPRSYDMTRTHIMHKGVNKHVDVVLRCSPKHWKKKKVSVTPVRGEKKNGAVSIRVHAAKGYVAVRKVTGEKYEADRKKVVAAYETKYGSPSENGKVLIHDMKSQLASMAGRSAEYIDRQLGEGRYAAQPEQIKPQIQTQQTQANVPLPQFPEVPEPMSGSMLSPETEAILKKGGYKRPKPLSPNNPYASDYLRQASDMEFRSLMESLEKSLDEACGKYAVHEPEWNDRHETPGTERDENYAYYENYENGGADFSLSVTDSSEIYAAPESSEDLDSFEPALKFSEGGEHYIPEDELFNRDFGNIAPPTEVDEGESLNISRFFMEEKAEFIPPQTDSDDSGDFALPRVHLSYGDGAALSQDSSNEEGQPDFNFYPDEGEQAYIPPTIFPHEEGEDFAPPTIFPDEEGEDFVPPMIFPDEEEEDFTPPTIFPDEEGKDFAPPTIFPDEEGEDFAPPTIFPDEEGEDFAPPTIFPDEEDDFVPPTIFPDDEGGYSPAPVSPDRNEYPEDGDYSARAEAGDTRRVETFLSRAGGQIKKAIGVIRGNGDNINSGKNGSYSPNDDIEITYSDQND